MSKPSSRVDILRTHRQKANMVQHLGEETSSIGTSGEAEKIDIVARRVVTHQKLRTLISSAANMQRSDLWQFRFAVMCLYKEMY
jgi:hypothetical protein